DILDPVWLLTPIPGTGTPLARFLGRTSPAQIFALMEEEARYVDHIVHDRYRHRGVLRSCCDDPRITRGKRSLLSYGLVPNSIGRPKGRLIFFREQSVGNFAIIGWHAIAPAFVEAGLPRCSGASSSRHSTTIFSRPRWSSSSCSSRTGPTRRR